MQQHTFQLTLKSKQYTIPTMFKHIVDMPLDIYNYLIFNVNHTYQVKSNVSEQVFQSFIDYLINDNEPDITLETFNQYLELNQEFHLLDSLLASKKQFFGEYLINLNGLRQKNSQFYEKEIAKKLDEYLQKYGDFLMESPIQSLYNIFNHKERNLTDHNLAYELIEKRYESSKNSQIFILLDFIDGTKLSKSNLSRAFSLKSDRFNHMPYIDFAFIENAISKVEDFQIQFTSLSTEFLKFKKDTETLLIENEKRYKDEILDLKTQIKQNEEKIRELTNLISNQAEKNKNEIINITELIQQKAENVFYVKPLIESKGILNWLKKKEETKFDRLFIASQSSCDIYNLIDPNTKDAFCLSPSNLSFIEFETKQSVTITGLKIFSSYKYFPKSFDIIINDETVFSTKKAIELNGPNKELEIQINPICSQKIRFVKTGPNWDKDTNYVLIKRIELLSNEDKYSKGVFTTLVESSKNQDPHKSNVFLSSKSYDFNSFYLFNTNTNTGTLNKENSWFQIEFTEGFAIITGFRLWRCNNFKVKNYKIICTNDIKKNIQNWTTLIEINEETENENDDDYIYEFVQPSPPVKYVRLVQTGQTWNNNLFLKFFGFDLFGIYF